MKKTFECENLVIGSGPGGSITACHLAEAGENVLLVEEGTSFARQPIESYSLEEMDLKYRNGGLTAALGKTNITYIEGKCLGGASEINAGLYHRMPTSILEDWKSKYKVLNLEENQLIPYYESIEQDLTISTVPNGVGMASNKIKMGADKLNWESKEIPKYCTYTENKDGSWQGARQSMSKTLIPRAVKAGASLLENTKIKHLHLKGTNGLSATAISTLENGRKITRDIYFKNVFVCAGAVQTPALLRRSGIKRNIGNSLSMHPMVRMPALFNERMYESGRGVPVHQVQEFKPHMTLGCSVNSPALLALWMSGQPESIYEKLLNWPDYAIYYASIISDSKGTIRNIPIIDEPLVRFNLSQNDMALMGEGLYRLSKLLFSVGAIELLSPVQGYPLIKKPEDIEIFKKSLPHGVTNITSIHLFSSCPMGEDTRLCATDSFGKIHGYKNIYINDASMLPSPPGVNPQGTIMALALRNITVFLERKLS